MNTKIAIKNLNFSYDNYPVLQDVNVSIRKGEVVTIVGPNGGGKTTLLRLILGLLKPESGTVLIDGYPSKDNKNIGYVPQYMYFDRKFPISVFDVVLSARLRAFGFYSKMDKIVAAESLEKVGLLSIKNKMFSNLSGGQTQRVLIARALATNTDLLLLDEPTSNIDYRTNRDINFLIEQLKKQGMTVLLVTHDTGFVNNITDRVLCVNRKLVEHPFDDNLNSIVSASYSRENKIVRHDISIIDGSVDNEGGD